jgi:hypothetical protein
MTWHGPCLDAVEVGDEGAERLDGLLQVADGVDGAVVVFVAGGGAGVDGGLDGR